MMTIQEQASQTALAQLAQDAQLALEKKQLRAIDYELAVALHHMMPEPQAMVHLLTMLTSYQYSRGHTCLDLEALLAEPAFLLGLSLLPPWLESYLTGTQLNELLQALQQSSWCVTRTDRQTLVQATPLTLFNNKLYLTRLFQAENKIWKAIQERISFQSSDYNQKQENQQQQLEQRQQGLARLFPDVSTADNPIPWQKLACAMAAQHRFAIITGGPGTGKTTTVVRLLGLLQLEHQGKLRVRLAAPTGKAAARLQESIGGAVAHLPEDFYREAITTDVTTIHKLLGAVPGKRQFYHHAMRPLETDVLIVDEASMIDVEMMTAIFDALSPQTKLILLGDKDQLASVEAGSVLADLCTGANDGGYTKQSLAYLQQFTMGDLSPYLLHSEQASAGHTLYNQVTVMLRHSYRFDSRSGIGELSRAVNLGQVERIESLFQQFDDIDWSTEGAYSESLKALVTQGYESLYQHIHRGVPAADLTADAADVWAKEALKKLGQFQILCAVREGREGVYQLNERVESWLAQQGYIQPEQQRWYEGKPIIIQKNDPVLQLMNGDVGLVLRHPQTQLLRVVFHMPDGSVRWLMPERLGPHQTVYAMTIHKSQGSEFQHTVMVLPQQDQPLLTKELIYTAITRASHKLSMFAQADIVNRACLRSVNRSSGL